MSIDEEEVVCRGWLPLQLLLLLLLLLLLRHPAQAGRAQAIGGGLRRHRQAEGFVRAPAAAGEIAVERGTAARAGERAGRWR